MKIEILYPELCCLYGDKGNTLFLQKCLPDAQLIYTQLNDKPAFTQEDVDLCCMYSMSEQSQELILSRWAQWQDEICDKIKNSNTFFLFLGNSFELLGMEIQREDKTTVPCLGLFDIHSQRHAPSRFNTLIQATFEGMTLLGYTSRFSETYGIHEAEAMCKIEIGTGSCPDSKLEGIRTTNLLGTYLLGPLLVANPDFSKWLLHRLGIKNPVLPYEDALYQAYETKRKEFQRPDLALD